MAAARRRTVPWIALTGLLALAGAAALGWKALQAPPVRPTVPAWTALTTPIAGGVRGQADGDPGVARFADPFGLVLDRGGNLYVSDGGDANRIRRIAPDGRTTTVAGGAEGFLDGPGASARFNTPSGLAIDKAGVLYVADTANNAIRKITPEGLVTTLAGDGVAGFRDGTGRAARFNGPLGVAVDAAGIVYVADTYNDRIRRITPDGAVTTLAGGDAPGFADGAGAAARFDTPVGLAWGRAGALLVADARNDAVRSLSPTGEVTTLIRAAPQDKDPLLSAPVALATTSDGYLYIASLDTGRILQRSPTGGLVALPAAPSAQSRDPSVRLARPSGLALDPDGALWVSEAARYRVSRLAPPSAPARAGPADSPRGGTFGLADVGGPTSAFPWPVAPQGAWHEVVGVMGEVRGAYGGDSRDHLHAGVDVRAEVGQTVLAVADGKVESPLPTWDFDGLSEGLRIDLLTYIHMRVGRTPTGALIDPTRFSPVRDEAGKLVRMRIKRGARFRRGEPLGTVNRMAHVHLELGPPGGRINALTLPFANLADHVAPKIRDIALIDSAGRRLPGRGGGVVVDRRVGSLAVVVDAYDQTDGNESRRRLGLYRLGYQLLDGHGVPLAGFETPRITLDFQRMPIDRTAVKLAYAPSSGDTVHGNAETRFLYVVTNRVRDGVAEPGAWRVAGLAPGDYTLRIYAADFAGNVATTGRDLSVHVQ